MWEGGSEMYPAGASGSREYTSTPVIIHCGSPFGPFVHDSQVYFVLSKNK